MEARGHALSELTEAIGRGAGGGRNRARGAGAHTYDTDTRGVHTCFCPRAAQIMILRPRGHKLRTGQGLRKHRMGRILCRPRGRTCRSTPTPVQIDSKHRSYALVVAP